MKAFTAESTEKVFKAILGYTKSLSFNDVNRSGQIIATSHDLTPNGGLVREIPLFQENPGW